ncbi:MAG: hypothetical protein ACLSWS_24855, partial [Faecalispora jeddahensis]
NKKAPRRIGKDSAFGVFWAGMFPAAESHFAAGNKQNCPESMFSRKNSCTALKSWYNTTHEEWCGSFS